MRETGVPQQVEKVRRAYATPAPLDAEAPDAVGERVIEAHDETPVNEGWYREADAIADLHAYRAARDGRDDLIRRAHGSGVSEAQIAKITGHSRTTVHSILCEQV